APVLQHHAGLALVVEAPGAEGDQFADTIRRELIGEEDLGRKPFAIEPGGGFLAGRGAAGDHDDGVGLSGRILHDEGATNRSKRGAVTKDRDRSQGERGQDQPPPRARHRSSSTRYSLIRRESGASGLRARYFRKASFALSLCLLW